MEIEGRICVDVWNVHVIRILSHTSSKSWHFVAFLWWKLEQISRHFGKAKFWFWYAQNVNQVHPNQTLVSKSELWQRNIHTIHKMITFYPCVGARVCVCLVKSPKILSILSFPFYSLWHTESSSSSTNSNNNIRWLLSELMTIIIKCELTFRNGETTSQSIPALNELPCIFVFI